MGRKKAFTLVELLVVISVIALLLSIMLPSLRKAKEQARVVVCLSNMKQHGYIIKTYMGDYDNRFMYDDQKVPNYSYDLSLAGELEFGWCGGDQTVDPMLWAPPAKDRLLYPYVKNFTAFQCPSDKGIIFPFVGGYWMPTLFKAMGNSYRYNYWPWSDGGPAWNDWDNWLRDKSIANKKESLVRHPDRFVLLHEPPATGWFDDRFFQWHYARSGEGTFADAESALPSRYYSPILFVDGHVDFFDFTESVLAHSSAPTAEFVWYQP